MAFKIVGLPQQNPSQPQAGGDEAAAPSAPNRFRVVSVPQAQSNELNISGMSKEQLMESYRSLPRDDPRREEVKQKIISDAAPDKMNTAQSLVAGATDTMSLGLSDEVQAGLSALGGGDYDAELKAQRDMMKTAAEDHPTANVVGQIAGALPALALTGGSSGAVSGAGLGTRIGVSALNGSADLAKGASLLTRAGVGAAENAAQMGVYGFGSGEGGAANRLTDAAIMATAGGVMGGALPVVGKAIGASGKAVGNAVSTTARPITNMINRGGSAENLVVNALRRDAEAAALGGREMLTPAEATAARRRGSDPIVADLGDDATGRLARASANASPEARMAIQNAATPRFNEQSERVANHIDSMYGGLDSAQTLDNLKAQAERTVRPLYERAMNDPRGQSLYTAELDNMLQSPAVQRAIDKAEERSAELAVAQGARPVKNPFVRDASGRMVLNNAASGATPSLAFWDIVKRNLDDEVSSLYRNGNADVAKDIKNIRNQLREHLDDLVPTYKNARGAAAAHFRANDAFEAGQKFASQAREGDVRRSMAFLRDLRRKAADPNNPAVAASAASELDLFERGFMSSHKGKIAGVRDSRDLTKSFFSSPLEREKLAAAVAPHRVAEIDSLGKVERIMQRVNNQVKGGSNTAQQLMDLGLAGGAGGVIGYATSGDPFSFGGAMALGRLGYKHLNQKMMQQVGEILASNDPNRISELVRRANSHPPTRNALNGLLEASGAMAAPLAPDLLIHAGDASSGEPGYKGGGMVRAVKGLLSSAKKAAPKEGEALIEDWKWRPEHDVANELGLQDQPVPDHVQAFGQYMKEMSDKAGSKGLSKRDMIKAFTITRSSIQRGAVKSDKLREAGFDIPGAGDSVRPEGAMAEWLLTPTGKRYLDNAEKGVIDEEAITDLQNKFRPFGKADKDVPDFMRGAVTTFDDDYVGQLSDLVARGSRGESSPEEWRAATARLRGIGPAKKGFIASMLGRGDQPTPDARQLVLQTGRPSKEASKFMARRGGKGGDAAVQRLAERQRKLNMKLPAELDPYYQHLVHHTIWDKVANEKTTHSDIIRAMRLAAQAGAIPAGAAAMYEQTLNSKPEQGFAKGGLIKATFADMLKLAGITDEKHMAAIADKYQNVKARVPAQDWSMEYIDNSKSHLLPENFISPEKFQGSWLTGMSGDRTNGGITVTKVNGNDVRNSEGVGVDLQAGSKFTRRAPGQNPDGSVWASNGAVVDGYEKRITHTRAEGSGKRKKMVQATYFDGTPMEGDVIGITNPMAETAGDFSTMNAELVLPQLDLKGISPDILDDFDARMAKRDDGKGTGFLGIRHPLAQAQLLGKHSVDGQTSAGNLRIAALQTMDSAKMRNAGFPDVGPSRWAATDPRLLTASEGDMGADIVKFDQNRPVIDDPIYKHRSYDRHVGGQYLGGFEELIPRKILFPDWHENFMKTSGAAQKARGVADHLIEGGMRNAFSWSDNVMQRADQQWLDRVMKYIEERKRMREMGLIR